MEKSGVIIKKKNVSKMKKLFSYLFLSLLVMGVASCSDEIAVENQTEQTTEHTLNVTGTIVENAETRVGLQDKGTSITPTWEVGDKVFGFYGENKLTYRVESIKDGVATFSLVEGTEPADGTTVYMIYAPTKSASDLSAGVLSIDLSAQDGTLDGLKNHAVMCATATVNGTSLSLPFKNQVAIVGVKQFTGLKASTTYTSATFTSAGPTATVKVDDGVLKLVTDDTYGTITATGSFTSDGSGKTTSTIYFAVPPAEALSHTFALHSADDHRAGNLSPRVVTAGKYLYMTSKAMTKPILFDDFESTEENAFPATLGIVHNGTGNADQKVIVSEKKNGSKALQLQGNGGWSANIVQNGSLEIDESVPYVMECYMYQVNQTGTANGGMGFSNWYSSGGYHTATVYWNSDQWNYQNGNGNTRSNYYCTNNTGRWYHLKIVCDFETRLYDIYVDGKNIVKDAKIDSRQPNHISLSAGNGGVNTVYFDDVIVYTKPRTPDNFSDFTQISYIQSSGSQYINTRVIPDENTKVELMNFYAYNGGENWCVFLGATAADGDATTWWFRKNAEGPGICSGIGTVKSSPYYNYAVDYTYGTEIAKISLDNTGLYINDVKASDYQYQNSITPGTNSLFIFSGNSNGSSWRPSYMRISGCVIYDGEKKIRDFVPVKRNIDNKIGLFDKVENIFYRNLGSGEFTGE